MEQIVFKWEFSVLFDAAKTESEQYLEEKINLLNILSKKIQEKTPKILILGNPDRFSEKSLRGGSYSMPGVSPFQIWY